MMKVLTDNEIKEVLKNRDRRLAAVREKRFEILRELQRGDELIRQSSLPGISLSDTAVRNHNPEKRDLNDILTAYHRQLSQRNRELGYVLQKLSEEEAMIDRVWTCFIKLDEPYYSIARALYVEKQPYKYVEQESGFSHRAFEERRRQAIKSIEVMYEKG